MPTTSKTTNRIGENLRAARTATGLTQLELGVKIGLNGPEAGAHVSRWETGGREPRFSTLQRIANVLGVSLDSLFQQKRKG